LAGGYDEGMEQNPYESPAPARDPQPVYQTNWRALAYLVVFTLIVIALAALRL